MEIFITILTEPFTLGLLLGICIAFWVGISAWGKQRALLKDIQALKEHLHTQVTISAKGNQAVTDENEQLKKQNENLRVSLASLKNKPDRTELRTLYLYDKGIRLMYMRAPGFAPVWESIMKEGEIEMEKISTGGLAWIRKIVRPSLAGFYDQLSTPTQSDIEKSGAERQN